MGFDGDHFPMVWGLSIEFQKNFYCLNCIIGYVVVEIKDPCVPVLKLSLNNFNFFRATVFRIIWKIER